MPPSWACSRMSRSPGAMSSSSGSSASGWSSRAAAKGPNPGANRRAKWLPTDKAACRDSSALQTGRSSGWRLVCLCIASPPAVSSDRDHCFEVLAWHRHCGVRPLVETPDERDEIAFERRLGLLRKGSEGLEHRAVVGAEHREPMLGRAVAEDKMALRRLNRRCMRSEQLGEPGARAPCCRRFDSGGW